MKKVLISMGFAALALGATAQVKIKDGSVTGSSTTPNTNAILELESNNKGLLYPRVALVSTDNFAPLTAHVKGMIVYDTVIAGTGATAVSPGLYYNDGTQWVRVSSNVQSSVFIYGSGTPQSYGATCNTSAQNTIYVDTLPGSPTQGQSWICSGSGWQTYTPPASTEWNYAGSANVDAGSNKTSAVSRAGSVVIGANILPYPVATSSSSSTAAQQLAVLTVAGGDASINGMTVGYGGGQINNNTVVGLNAGVNNTTGFSNTAFGQNALYLNTTGYDNTGIGYHALYSNIAGGNNNTGIGFQVLAFNTTGGGNTALGFQSGSNITTGSYNILIGYGTAASSPTVSGEITVGNGVNTSLTRVSSSGGTWVASSDRRLKHDIQPITQGLNFVEKLKPVEYVYNISQDGKKALGFIAQDVQQVMQQENMNPDKYTLVPKIQGDTLGLTYMEFIPILTKAIQEQQVQIKTLQVQNENQQTQNDKLQAEIEKLQAEVDALKK